MEKVYNKTKVDCMRCSRKATGFNTLVSELFSELFNIYMFI